MYPSQISPTKKAKLMTPNQSSAAAAPRRSVTTPCEASSASGASSASRLTSCGGPMNAAPNRMASEANAGTKSRGFSCRRSPRSPSCSARRSWGQVGRLSGGDALVYDVRSFGGGQPKLPDFVGGFASQMLGERGGDVAGNFSTECIGINARFAEDAGGAHDSVLGVRASFAFEAERFLEVESDH